MAQRQRRDWRLAEAASSRQSGSRFQATKVVAFLATIGCFGDMSRRRQPLRNYRATSKKALLIERQSRLPVPPVLTVFVRAFFAGSAACPGSIGGAGIGWLTYQLFCPLLFLSNSTSFAISFSLILSKFSSINFLNPSGFI